MRPRSQPIKAYRRDKNSDSKLFMLDHKHITWSYHFKLSKINSDLAQKFNCIFQAIAIISQKFCCHLSCWEHLYQEHLTKACFSLAPAAELTNCIRNLIRPPLSQRSNCKIIAVASSLEFMKDVIRRSACFHTAFHTTQERWTYC